MLTATHSLRCPPRLPRSGRVSWPAEEAGRYPEALRELTAACLSTEPAERPFIGEVIARAEALARGPPAAKAPPP